MAYQLFTLPKQVPLSSGAIVPGARLRLYLTGTTTPAVGYSDSALTTPITQPIEADAAGVFPPIYLDQTVTYKATVSSSADVLLYTVDPVNEQDNYSAALTELASTDIGSSGSSLIGFRRPESGSVGEAVYDILRRQVRLMSFGADNTGVADCKSAFDSAIAACAALNHTTLIVDHGMYRFASAPAPIGYGIMIMGHGSQGTTEPYGTVFLFDYDAASGDGLTWNGNGGAGFRGTGGGLQNITLLAADGRVAGRCIYLLATSSNNRPGEMVFHNVLSFGQGTGTWDCNIEIDGRNANTSGSKGVRTVRFSKVRVADCATAYKNLWFRQAVHISGSIDIDTGNGTSTIGMTVDDDWDNLQMDKSRLGNVVINYSGASNPTLQLDARVSSFDNNSANVIGTVHLSNYGSAGTVANASPNLRISGNMVDCFYAYRSSTATNQTGDGTTVSVVFDTESYDENASYDNTTGLATFKCAGKYQVNWGIVLTSLGAAHTTGELLLRHRDSGGTLKNSISHKFGVGPARDAANQCSLHESQVISVAEGDTMDVRILVSGSTLTVGVGGGAGTRYGGFSARLLS